MTSRTLWKAAAAATALALAGCQTVTYRTRSQPVGEPHEQMAPYFLWGLAGDNTINLDQICPSGVARWQNQETFLDGFLGALTLGIFVPRTVTVYCAGPRTADGGAVRPGSLVANP